ncbi:MAG: NAD(P)H-hydrate epimerase, partial [Chloroflexi bacterium]|nr:NAD(P)H-hydrate epimerase [Chloroflexota bacterium]
MTVDQMREVDRLMVEEFGIKLLQMMENAGRSLAVVARDRFLQGDPQGASVVVMAGRGGNGGGGLVCARRLHSWGCQVIVLLSVDPSGYRGVPAHQLSILEKIGIPTHSPGDSVNYQSPKLIIDALVGYSLRGSPEGYTADLIRNANASDAPVLALDIPSGVDGDQGEVRTPAIEADATLTLALPKVGLYAKDAMRHVGELYLGDIGVPPELYRR